MGSVFLHGPARWILFTLTQVGIAPRHLDANVHLKYPFFTDSTHWPELVVAIVPLVH